RMRQVDEPVLLLDRGDRVRERESARDLLREEETDHLALAVGLDLLARDHGQRAAARALDRLERAAEAVVIGHRDRAETLGLRMVDELVDLYGAVVRPARVHVQVREDPLPVGERIERSARLGHAPALRQPPVELVVLTGDGGERLLLRARAPVRGAALAERVVLREARGLCGGELRL